ncbi:MAG: hypothetical protein FWH17_08980 [Oscillospiraceae bacterium]|nr:hypothetical protein [Oscillospiraceae bacterium]
MERAIEARITALRELLEEKLSHNPHSQEYVDSVVEKIFMDNQLGLA